MDWKKLNFDEIGYFCKSTKMNITFDCFPLSYQIEVLLGILYYYDIRQFQIKDIQNIYSVLHVSKMKSEGILAPRPRKIQTILEKLAAKGYLSIEANAYIITDKNEEMSGLYREDIEKGYEKDYINGWIAYDREHSMIKTENIPL